MSPETPNPDGRRTAAANRRRIRQRALLDATRKLFDARGSGDAQLEDIANEVGINRALVYRQFTGKEELFALTLCDYLAELRDTMAKASEAHVEPADRLTAITEAFVDYSVDYPAFVDCAVSLMRRTGDELFGEISDSAMVKLGASISNCLLVLSQVLEEGTEQGVFSVTDPQLTANLLYATSLGGMQLARVGILVEPSPGVPTLGTVTPEQVKAHLVALALSFTRP